MGPADSWLVTMKFEDICTPVITPHRLLRAGTVTVNCFGEGTFATPFGGYGQSGFGGRDNGVHAFEQYTQLKTLWIDTTDRELESGVT